jgi:hypothetical protein
MVCALNQKMMSVVANGNGRVGKSNSYPRQHLQTLLVQSRDFSGSAPNAEICGYWYDHKESLRKSVSLEFERPLMSSAPAQTTQHRRKIVISSPKTEAHTQTPDEEIETRELRFSSVIKHPPTQPFLYLQDSSFRPNLVGHHQFVHGQANCTSKHQ